MIRARLTLSRATSFGILAAFFVMSPALYAQEQKQPAAESDKQPADKQPAAKRPAERRYPQPHRLYGDLPARRDSRVKIAGHARPYAEYRDRLEVASEQMNFYYRPRLPHPYRFYGGYYGYEYEAGVSDGRHFERLEIQAERGSREYAIAMESGYQAFGERRYADAALSFIHAATVHQGDPGARLNAAHAQVALGQYESAARLIHRALELQPRIPYLPLDIRGSYSNHGDFDAHLTRLVRTTEENNLDPDLWFLVGYYAYFSGDRATAADAWAQSLELRPGDEQVEELENLARMTAPSHEDPRESRPERMERIPAKSNDPLKKI